MLVTREERRHENRKTLLILIGVIAMLVAVSVATIIGKH